MKFCDLRFGVGAMLLATCGCSGMTSNKVEFVERPTELPGSRSGAKKDKNLPGVETPPGIGGNHHGPGMPGGVDGPQIPEGMPMPGMAGGPPGMPMGGMHPNGPLGMPGMPGMNVVGDAKGGSHGFPPGMPPMPGMPNLPGMPPMPMMPNGAGMPSMPLAMNGGVPPGTSFPPQMMSSNPLVGSRDGRPETHDGTTPPTGALIPNPENMARQMLPPGLPMNGPMPFGGIPGTMPNGIGAGFVPPQGPQRIGPTPSDLAPVNNPTASLVPKATESAPAELQAEAKNQDVGNSANAD